MIDGKEKSNEKEIFYQEESFFQKEKTINFFFLFFIFNPIF